MKGFNELCKEFEEMDVVTYSDILVEKSATILPALEVITQDGLTGTSIFLDFIMGAIAADGRLSEEEYLLVEPMLKSFFGDAIDYESCKKIFKASKKENKALKSDVDEMVDMLGLLSDDLKADIIIVCMLICAIDGKISLKEKNWIKKLIK